MNLPGKSGNHGLPPSKAASGLTQADAVEDVLAAVDQTEGFPYSERIELDPGSIIPGVRFHCEPGLLTSARRCDATYRYLQKAYQESWKYFCAETNLLRTDTRDGVTAGEATNRLAQAANSYHSSRNQLVTFIIANTAHGRPLFTRACFINRFGLKTGTF